MKIEAKEKMQDNGVDLNRIAEKIVNDCLRVKPGENFWISCADFYYWSFAEAVAKAAVKAGAYPLITVTSDELSLMKLKNPVEYLKKTSDFQLRLTQTADVTLDIVFPRDPYYIKDVPPENLAAGPISAIPIKEEIYRRNRDQVNLRKSSFLHPTPEAAQKYGLPFEEYSQMVWSAVDIDYESISKRAKKIASVIRGAKQVKIKSEDGTDLKFSIEGRRVFIDDGIFDEEDITGNSYLQNLPTGEVYVPPVETSAEGVAVFQYNVFMGEPLKNFRVRFEKGKIVEMDADEGLEHYRNIMEKNTGDKLRIAELGIGLNPEITRVTGGLALDEKIIGTVHIATGENRMFGGKNESSIHWDLVMKNPTLIVENKVIMENGRYLI